MKAMKHTQTNANTALRHQIARFTHPSPNMNPVAASTLADLNTLLNRLHEISEAVSAVTSNDGVLPIAAVLREDQRLYLEIQRDGTLEATVSRSRTHAEDLSVTTISALINCERVTQFLTQPRDHRSQK